MEVKFGNKTLTETEKEQLYLCISCRLGIIETGIPSMRAIDAQNSGKNDKIKALTTDQKKLTIMLEELMNNLI